MGKCLEGPFETAPKIFWDRLDFIASWSQGHINECKAYKLYGLALCQKRQQKMKVN